MTGIHLVFDGNATAFRANVVSELYTKQGFRTSAIVGTLNITHTTVQYLKKEYNLPVKSVIYLWDAGHSPRRDTLFPDYKIKRTQNITPEEEQRRKELYQQIDVLYQVLPSFGIKTYRKYHWEGDDLIWGTIKELGKIHPDDISIIISNDEDFHQLLDYNVHIFSPIKKILYTKDNYRELAGIDPETFLFYKILKGDSSDCIPGIQGIGEVTAKSLVNKYHTLDNMFEHKDELLQSKRLSRICTKEGLSTLSRNNKLINLKEYVDLSPVKEDIHNMLTQPSRVNYKEVREFMIKYQMIELLMKLKEWLEEFVAVTNSEN